MPPHAMGRALLGDRSDQWTGRTGETNRSDQLALDFCIPFCLFWLECCKLLRKLQKMLKMPNQIC
jgi:hypothetical protein